MRATSIPLYVDETLGGWGVPHPLGERTGYRSSPKVYRKALAVVLTSNDPKQLNALREHFTFTAPSRDAINVDSFISAQRKNWKAVRCTGTQKKILSVFGRDQPYQTPNGKINYHASTLERALRQRLGGLMALNNHSDRRAGPLRYLPRTLGKRFARTCRKLAGKWESVQPIALTKARDLVTQIEETTFYELDERSEFFEGCLNRAVVSLPPRTLNGPMKPPGDA